jgi:Flp pilus assembly protein TadD
VNPDQSDCRYNLGIALAHVNDPQGAREQFEKALALGASDPSIRSEYAKVLRTLGETKLAAEQFELYQKEEKAKGNRTQAAITMARGDTELANDNSKRAAELYREAIAAMPEYALLYYKLSVALDRLGDTAAERENLLKAVQIDPGMAIAHRQLGYLAFNDGDFVSAEDHLRKAVAAAPTYADAWVSLAATLGTESRISEAQQAVQKALEIDPQNANAIDLQKQLNAGSQAHP